jgi:hypothetical protein
VSPVSRAIRINEPCRILLAASLFVALIGAHDGIAASVSSAQGNTAAPHDCKCATKCRGDSCCCGPHKVKTQAPSPEPTDDPDRKLESPCQIKSIPCGDSGLPSASSNGPVSKNASLVKFERLRLATVGSLLPFSTHRLIPDRWASQLDRPPERLPLA